MAKRANRDPEFAQAVGVNVKSSRAPLRADTSDKERLAFRAFPWEQIRALGVGQRHRRCCA
jgi:hypothetical protein